MDNPGLALLVLKVTVLLLVGAAVAQALRRANAGARHLVWLATLAGLLLLPALPRFAPFQLEVVPHSLVAGEEAKVVQPGARVAQVEATTPLRKYLVEAAPRNAAVAAAEARPSRPFVVTIRQSLFAVWGAGALILLGFFAAGVLTVRRIIRTAEPLDDPGWSVLLAEAADRLDLARLPKLVSSDRVEVPFAFGAWSPTIVLPARAAGWSDERRRLVLSHELGHIKRRDLVGHALARVACALYWCHPLVWVAARRLRAESERACDDIVLGSGARASDYADHLLDILASVRREDVPAAALAMARRREFEGRLLAILDPALKRGGPRRMQSMALLGGLAVLFLTVAASAPSRPPASTSGLPIAEASTEPAAAAVPPASASSPLTARPAVPAPVDPESVAPIDRPEADGPDASALDADEREADEEKPRALEPSRRATLVRVLQSDSEASVRRTAAWALAESPETDAAEALAAALGGDGSAEVREMAAWALNETHGERSTTALADALRRDASREVRATAAWALGQRRLGDASALLAAVSDSSPEVREVAIWAVGNQSIEKAPEALRGALRDADGRVRVVAAWALAQIRDPASIAALRASFEDEKDDEVRRAFFHALVLIGEHSPELTEWAFGSKDAELRRVAVQMLASRGLGPWPWPWPRPEPRPFP